MFLGAIILGLIIAVVIGVPLGIYRGATAENVSCPICGHTTALPSGSGKCPACKTRIVRATNGDLITK